MNERKELIARLRECHATTHTRAIIDAAADMLEADVQPAVPQEPKCSEHPDAPHGFNRTASHTLDRYVCECEGWVPDNAEVSGPSTRPPC